MFILNDILGMTFTTYTVAEMVSHANLQNPLIYTEEESDCSLSK